MLRCRWRTQTRLTEERFAACVVSSMLPPSDVAWPGSKATCLQDVCPDAQLTTLTALLAWLDWGRAEYSMNSSESQTVVTVDFAVLPQVQSAALACAIILVA